MEGATPRRGGELVRTYGRTSYSPPVPHQRPKKGGRSLHDDPSGASPAGRVNGPQGRTFLPVGGWRGSPHPFTGVDSGILGGRPATGGGGGASGRKAQCPAPPRRTRHPSSDVRLFAGTAPATRE